MTEGSFPLSAVVSPVGRRNQHFRDRDHSGVLASSNVVLSAAIGPHVTGTPVNDVLAAIVASIASNYPLHSIALDAFVKGLTTGQIILWSVVRKTQATTFTIDARKA